MYNVNFDISIFSFFKNKAITLKTWILGIITDFIRISVLNFHDLYVHKYI